MIPGKQETEERQYACIGVFPFSGLPICAAQRDGDSK
jgi:hypothetical protein